MFHVTWLTAFVAVLPTPPLASPLPHISFFNATRHIASTSSYPCCCSTTSNILSACCHYILPSSFLCVFVCQRTNARAHLFVGVCVCVSVNVREFRIDALIARISKWGTNPSEGRGDTFLLLPPSLSLLLSLASLIH